MPKWSAFEKSLNTNPCTMYQCHKCKESNWYVFVFKDTVELHCKYCAESRKVISDLNEFCLVEFKDENK